MSDFKYFNPKSEDSALENKLFDQTIESLERENLALSKAKANGIQLTAKDSKLVAAAQRTREQIKLADPVLVDSVNDFTTVAAYATALSPEVLNMPNSVSETDPIMKYVKPIFHEEQEVNFDFFHAITGFSDSSMWGNGLPNSEVPSRSMSKFTTGFFGNKVTLNQDLLTLNRASGKLGGSYRNEVIARAVAQCVVRMRQQQRKVVFDTITNGQFTYYTNVSKSIAQVMSFGRLDSSVIEPATKWATYNAATRSVVRNAAANPLQDLLKWFSEDQFTIIANTRPYLKGLVMSPVTAQMLTLQGFASGNAMEATSFFSAKMGGFDAKTMLSNIPALAGVDIHVIADTFQAATDPNFGSVSQVDYVVPAGIIIPIIDYDKVGMGMMLMTSEPRKDLFNSIGSPENTLYIGDQRANYMRMITSAQNPMADSVEASVEIGARYSYINPLAAGTSYVLSVFDYV